MAHGSLVLVLITWLVAALAIITLGGALLEVTSVKKATGILGWTRVFTHPIFHKAAVNYNKYFFIPVSIFALALYAASSLNFINSPLVKNSYFIWAVAFGFFLWFMVANFFSLRLGEYMQWITTAVQMVPLVLIPILALTQVGSSGSGLVVDKDIDPPVGLGGTSRWIVLIAGLPAICFAYDGFYTVGALKQNLKNPRKVGGVLMWGLIAITFIYMFLSVAFNLGSRDGTHQGIDMPLWLRHTFDICIGVGILGIVNGYVVASPYQYRQLSQDSDGWDIVKLSRAMFGRSYQSLSARQQFKASWFYLLITTSLFFLVFGLVGILGYQDQSNWPALIYGASGKLFQFADVLLNYSSLITFMILATIVLGCLINRKTKTVEVEKRRFFAFYAFFSLLVFYGGGLYIVIAALVDMTGFNQASTISGLIQFLIILSVLIMSTIPAVVSFYRGKNTRAPG